MGKVYFHVDVNSAFLSWSALKALREGAKTDLRTIPAVVGGDEEKAPRAWCWRKACPRKNTASAPGNLCLPRAPNARA